MRNKSRIGAAPALRELAHLLDISSFIELRHVPLPNWNRRDIRGNRSMRCQLNRNKEQT
jgi:hypothetical protein